MTIKPFNSIGGFSVNDSNIIVNGNGDITSNSVTSTGNVITESGAFFGDGYGISNITRANINGLGNISTVDLSGNSSTYLDGTGNWVPLDIPAAYGNADVENLLSSGNVTSNIITTANISGGNVLQDGVRAYKWTTSNVAPSNPVPGDNWYNSDTDALFIYVNDGVSNQWVDQTTPSSFNTIITGNVYNLGANAVGSIGNSSMYYGNAYVNYYHGDGSNLEGLTTSQITDIGNISTINLSGNGSTVLTGNGVWTEFGTGDGTVTNVGADGEALGFSLSGNITTSGNITLSGPTAAELRTSLTIGNVANLDLNGNSSTYLDGTGSWATITIPASYGNANVENLLSSGNVTSNIITSANISGGNVLQDGVRAYKWTTSNVAPSNPVPGDNWYNSDTDALFIYVNDGVSSQWVDQTTPSSFNTIIAGNVYNLGSDGIGSIGNVSSYYGNAYVKFYQGDGSNLTGLTTSQIIDIGNVSTIDLNGNDLTVLSGLGTWVTSNDGTVTRVGGDGAALGFSLSGNVTTDGNITLSGPTAANLRTTLNIGTAANVDLNGNVSTVLAGDGSWVTTGGGNASGTVTNVSGTGNALGFNLSGNVSTSGSLTLAGPTAAELRTTLNIGTAANVDLNGNSLTYLAGDGSWAAISGGTNIFDNLYVTGSVTTTDTSSSPTALTSDRPSNYAVVTPTYNGYYLMNGYMYFPTASSFVSYVSNPVYVTPSAKLIAPGDFTIEAWTRMNTPELGYYNQYNFPSIYAITDQLSFSLWSNTGTSTGYSIVDLSTGLDIDVPSTYDSDWVHVAVSNSGGTATLYVNGTGIGTGTVSGATNFGNLSIASGNVGIGGVAVGTIPVEMISDLRISNVARYTSDFTPAAYGPDANTLLFTGITNTGIIANSISATSMTVEGTLSIAGPETILIYGTDAYQSPMTDGVGGVQFVGIGGYTEDSGEGGKTLTLGPYLSGGDTIPASLGRVSDTEVSIGYNAGGGDYRFSSIAIGTFAGNTQGSRSVAIGTGAGGINQGDYCVAIGSGAGTEDQAAHSIAIMADPDADTYSIVNSGLYISPIREDDTNLTNTLHYDATTKEVTFSTLGSYSSLSVTGNVVLSDVSNVTITGGNIGDVMITDGTGNLSFKTSTYGSFYDTTTQVNSNVGNAIPMTFNTTDISNNVSIVANSQITIATAGTFNLQFSAQFDRTNTGTDVVYVWLAKNGTAVGNSNTGVVITGGPAANPVVAAWNFLVESDGNDYFELMWGSADANIEIQSNASPAIGPAIPSIILTVVPVGV